MASSLRTEPVPAQAQPGLIAALLACLVGLLFAAVSVYWGLGGRWLLDTVGGDLAERADEGGWGLGLVVWGAAAVKVVAALLPLPAVRRTGRPGRDRWLRRFAWVEAGILTTYGLVLSAAGLLVQSGFIDSTGGDHKALAWHAYLWDPWFLVWGLLVTAAMLRSRSTTRRENPETADAPHRL